MIRFGVLLPPRRTSARSASVCASLVVVVALGRTSRAGIAEFTSYDLWADATAEFDTIDFLGLPD